MLSVSGCMKSDSSQKDAYLLKAGVSRITVADFNRSFEVAKTAYGPDVLGNPSLLSQIRPEVLKQLVERLILMERAREIGLDISEPDIEKAIASAKEGYPENEFEKTLLEAGVSYDSWKTELKARLLMEKVIETDLEQQISVTPDDIAAFSKEYAAAPKDHAAVIKQIRKKKAESLYPKWIENLRKTYKVDINETEWKKIADS
jgi:peptidyl-prolyl cis-trans isomerase C